VASDLSAESVEALSASGWKPGRRVAVDKWRTDLESEGFVMHKAAEDFLSEFGGLFVDVRGPGLEYARVPFELDPMLCSGEQDRFAGWGRKLGKSFFPIGELDYGHFFLAIDAEGVIYLIVDVVERLSVNEKGLDMLIRGIAAERLSG
jgi:hypothetical protein